MGGSGSLLGRFSVLVLAGNDSLIRICGRKVICTTFVLFPLHLEDCLIGSLSDDAYLTSTEFSINGKTVDNFAILQS